MKVIISQGEAQERRIVLVYLSCHLPYTAVSK